MSTFGERLRDLRMNRNLHQSQLGEILGLSPSAIGSYERNLREPAYKHLAEMADLFNVSVDYLLCRTDEPLTVEEFKKLDAREMRQLLNEYDVLIGSYKLQESDKNRLYDVAHGLFWDKIQNS
jgi:transcriptional regulator with XRE-family HTH domain